MDPRNPFKDFQPFAWQRVGSETVYSVKRNHGIESQIRFHNPHDEINDGRHLLKKVVLEYRIGHNRYELYTISDFFEVTYALDHHAAVNIMWDLAERIARRITKYFLKHYSTHGYMGGIFDKHANPKARTNFVVAHTADYVLKIERYPNLVILKHSGRGKFGYENIKELDGLFDYRFQNLRHIVVLESKLDRINVDCDDLVHNLFRPLRKLIPNAHFSYLLFSTADAIYVRKDLHKYRRLRQQPLDIWRTLHQEGVGTLFFTFNESYGDFERMKDHLINQYRSVAHLGMVLHGKMVLSDHEIILFDGGETPHIKLVKDPHSGMWREVQMRHKSR